MRDTTQTFSLGREDPLEVDMATHSSSCPENSMDRGAWRATVHRLKELDMTEEASERIDSLGQQPLTLWEVVGNADSL